MSLDHTDIAQIEQQKSLIRQADEWTPRSGSMHYLCVIATHSDDITGNLVFDVQDASSRNNYVLPVYEVRFSNVLSSVRHCEFVVRTAVCHQTHPSHTTSHNGIAGPHFGCLWKYGHRTAFIRILDVTLE